jgi:Cellulose biosynthesis GIL
MTTTISTQADHTEMPSGPSNTAITNLPSSMSARLASKPTESANGAGIHLGVTGIDSRLSQMASGGLYAIQVTTPSTRFALLATSLKSAMSAGVHCTLITNSSPEEVLSRLAQCNSFPANDLVKQKRLSVFSMQDEFSKKLFRFGADRFVQEIENFEIPITSFIAFEQADDLLSLHDLWLASQQIKVLSQWFKRRKTTGLMAFTRSNAQQTAALNALMDNLSGLARLGADKAGLELTFLYWQSPNGVTAARNFHLQSAHDGGYAVLDQPPALERSVQLPDSNSAPHYEQQVDLENANEDKIKTLGAEIFTTNIDGNVSSEMAKQIAAQITAQLAHARNSLAESSQTVNDELDIDRVKEAKKAARGSTHFYIHNDPEYDQLANQMPGKFYFAQSISDILHNALERPKAMILLTVYANQEVTTVANTIHTIRKNVGGLTKIVVRERSGSLSQTQSTFLRLCGVNELIQNDEPISNLPARLLEILDNPSNVLIEPNFNAIYSNIAPQLADEISSTSRLEQDQLNPITTGLRDQQSTAPVAQRVIEKAKRSAIRAARQV